MRVVKTIRIFYSIYTAYTVFMLLVSNYKVYYAAIGLLFMWMTFFSFFIGYKVVPNKTPVCTVAFYNKFREQSKFPLASIATWPQWKYFLAAITTWASAILSAKYYTGRSFGTVIKSIMGSGSAYNDYQQYFQQNNIATFSLIKLPYILMLAYLTIMMTWSILGLVLGDQRVSFGKKVYLIAVSGAYAYFGAARGTNFETYILFVVFAFCLLQKIRTILNSRNLKYFVIVFLVGVVLVYVYRVRIMNRGVEFENYICPEIQFSSNSLIARTFPTIVNIGVSLFSYLGYGIYCMGVTIQDVCLRTIPNIASLFIPSGYHIIGGESLGVLLMKTINMEVRWIPDFVFLLDSMGIILYFVFFFLLGIISHMVQTSSLPRLLMQVIEVLIFIEMLSVPVGNFLMSSSSNKLMLLFTIIWFVTCKISVGTCKTSRSETSE